MLVLFFLFLAHIALSRAIDSPERRDNAAAILALIAVITLLLVNFSVDWWNTRHQPASVVKRSGTTIQSSILIPLRVMGLAFLMVFITMVLMRTESQIGRRRLEMAALFFF